MAVRVRYRQMELTVGVEYETFADADYYYIHEDNTLELRQRVPGKKYRVVGHVHSSRWESARVLAEEESR